ncbi:MAG TPA: DsbA family protein [Hyphomicrobiaceae bacterium]|nr:DsbA family protein [Hyphomicrobiaceae bacterium]
MSAPATLYIDYRSPFSYLIKDPVEALEREIGVNLRWLPYRVDLEGAHGHNVHGRSEREWRKIRYLYADVRRIANRRSPPLVVRGTVKIFDPTLAHIAMLVAQDAGDDVFRRYHTDVQVRLWRREIDIEDRPHMRAALVAAGGDAAALDHALDSGLGEERLAELQSAANAEGVFGVPMLRIHATGELFWGTDRFELFREALLAYRA